jgi:hypothetical protein
MFFRNLRHLNTLLPFSEGERLWLLDWAQEQRAHRYDGEQFVSGLLPVEATIISGGLRQALIGRDLARRWPAWLRAEHEFKGQGSLQAAQEVLGHIIRHVVPIPDGLRDDQARDFPYAAQFLTDAGR